MTRKQRNAEIGYKPGDEDAIREILAELGKAQADGLPSPTVFGCWPPCQRRTLHTPQARKDPA